MIVIRRRSKAIKSNSSAGISNNTPAEHKESFVKEALLDYARQCRGTRYALTQLSEIRREK